MTKFLVVFILAVAVSALAQNPAGIVTYRVDGAGPGDLAFGGALKAPVTNAPYSATVQVESTRTLADGNRIVQNLTGSVARDSQGRTRVEPPAPTGSNAPQVVMLQDPVAKTVYLLDLKNKTAKEMVMPSAAGIPSSAKSGPDISAPTVESFASPGPIAGQSTAFSVGGGPSAARQTKTENLGFQTMEGLLVSGKRITRTIPAGQIGNAKPITIVTEEWTSPDLKTVVYSKTDNPTSGVQIYKLTNISRNEPDHSLFTVPSDFTIIQGSTMAVASAGGQN